MRLLPTRIVVPLVVLVVGTRPSLGYAQVETPLSFEVASVKPNNSASPARRFGVPADRFIATNEPLSQLIAVAYGRPGPLPQPLSDFQITGGPGWINADRFDVEAKAAGDVIRGTEGTQRKQLMLRTLLAQRFKLALHHETKQMSVYALVLARRDQQLGPKLRRTDVDCAAVLAARRSSNPPVFVPAAVDPCSFGASIGGVLKGGAMTMTELTGLFSRWLDRTVLDRTGLTGAFEVELGFSPEGLPGLPTPPPGVERPPTDNPPIFTAVEEQLGLKLESTIGPVDVLVIDHVETPTPD